MTENAYGKMAAHVIEGLKKRNIEGYYCETKAEARELASRLILEEKGADTSVSWGGSATIGELKIIESLTEAGCHMISYPEEEKREIGSPVFKEVAGCDYFLMGTNAITRNGELVNIDGASNRVSSLLHGPKHVLIVAGVNKIVKDVKAGIDRIQTQVCPVLADHTKRQTPCGVAGYCTDCTSLDCMCCNIVITRRSRYTGRVKVILVGEHMGI